MIATLRTAVALLLLAASSAALALDVKPYSAAALAEAQRDGKPVALFFHADWCPTCKQQDKAITQLQTEQGLNLTILKADYDQERELKRQLKVRTQSTLIVYKGADEKGRSAGVTDIDQLRSALKAAL